MNDPDRCEGIPRTYAWTTGGRILATVYGRMGSSRKHHIAFQIFDQEQNRELIDDLDAIEQDGVCPRSRALARGGRSPQETRVRSPLYVEPCAIDGHIPWNVTLSFNGQFLVVDPMNLGRALGARMLDAQVFVPRADGAK